MAKYYFENQRRDVVLYEIRKRTTSNADIEEIFESFLEEGKIFPTRFSGFIEVK